MRSSLTLQRCVKTLLPTSSSLNAGGHPEQVGTGQRGCPGAVDEDGGAAGGRTGQGWAGVSQATLAYSRWRGPGHAMWRYCQGGDDMSQHALPPHWPRTAAMA